MISISNHLKKKPLIVLLTCLSMLWGCKSDDPVTQPEPEPPIQEPDKPGPDDKPTLSLDVPDKDGFNVKGIVYCDNSPIEGAVISDGMTVTVTDANGHYYLKSDKRHGYVFISIPSGYSVSNIGIYPRFYKTISSNADKTDQANFSLTVNDKKEHVVLALADIHLAKRNDDIAQFNKLVIPTINSAISGYKAAGKDVYCITLGDQSWDAYWYSANYALDEAMEEIEKLKAPVFNCLGNHDNDPYFPDDFEAENTWRTKLGPTYYSFNLGNIHYVVLDNILYKNAGASEGHIGDRKYDGTFTERQLQWLKADLEQVKDKTTPIVVCMHIQFFNKLQADSNGNVEISHRLTNADELATLLKPFSDVRMLTGHTHYNFTVVDQNSSIIEYNTAAVCAAWWLTGRSVFASRHICIDGSPGGYRVLETSGRNIQTYYQPFEEDRSYVFRTYDLNECQITPEKYCPGVSNEKLSSVGASIQEYLQPNKNNEVLINIFAYDKRWKLSVTENGKELPYLRVKSYDPLALVTLTCRQLGRGQNLTGTTTVTDTSHLFKVKASSPTSTLEIKVTDEYGNVYTQTMTRPKALTIQSR